MSNVHNLMEYHFALEVVRDYPIIKKELVKTQKLLYDYSSYRGVQHSIQAINESLEILDMQLSYYSNVLARKGKE